jgi:hypothetical protein
VGPNIDIIGKSNDTFTPEHEPRPGWNPTKFVRRSDLVPGEKGVPNSPQMLFIKSGDTIEGTVLSKASGTFNPFRMVQKSRQSSRSVDPIAFHYIHNQLHGREVGPAGSMPTFYKAINELGFPVGSRDLTEASITYKEFSIPTRSAGYYINRAGAQPNFSDYIASPILYMSMMAPVETSEQSGNIASGGRRFASRPFLHSSPLNPGFLSDSSRNFLYHYGWNWWLQPISEVSDAPIEVSLNNKDFYGGGYTAENGSTNVIQQQLPLVPPISIASLSHARIGGYSLSGEPPARGYQGIRTMNLYAGAYKAYQRVTAAGFTGPSVHFLQAIGNSYAHPMIPADKATTLWNRNFTSYVNSSYNVILADQSYLANKALWDDYFFSSISPKPGGNPIYGTHPSGAGKTAQQVAQDFFFPADASQRETLPNRRIRASTESFVKDDLDALLGTYDLAADGFADKIAAHLMVAGPFNVNSTSVEAWRTVLSSLKGTSVALLDRSKAINGTLELEEKDVDGVPVSSGPVVNGDPFTGSVSDPSEQKQWVSARILTDTEIGELAEAMVRQVRLRGPFLSLSEFVNRRLDRTKPELSVKGALQAALDDTQVSINEGFRTSKRQFSATEKAGLSPAFPQALEGAVAYGSNAYIDQADILRNFGEQLTPRGDTFVIRAYGDALDASGKVIARAWCEAVVQRLPEYVDPSDQPHVDFANLNPVNRSFGRRFSVVSFRWLQPSEV